MTTWRAERIPTVGYRVLGYRVLGYWALLAACSVVALGSLVIGGIVAIATHWSGISANLAASAAQGSALARGILAGIPRSEPLGQVLLDYGFSALNLVFALALLYYGARSWGTLLLALALICSAGAFNLQAGTAALTVQTATGQSIKGVHDVALQVALAAYLVALVLFPTGRWDIGPRSGSRRYLVMIIGAGAVLSAVRLVTTLVPWSIGCVLFFGLVVPFTGFLVLPYRVRRGASAQQQTQARLLLCVLAAAFGATVVLGIITLLVWSLDVPGMALANQDAGVFAGLPAAPLFWFSRLESAAIVAAVLIAARRNRLWTAERRFSRGLATALVVVLAGGGFVVLRALALRLTGDRTGAAAALATALVAVAFLPLYVHIERLVDRLLYGSRPTPYHVLGELTALSRAPSTAAPDLAGVAEAIARVLNASSCRLTVVRPGLWDRTYAWPDGQAAVDPDAHVVLPIRLGDEQIGTVSVDRAAVAGLHAQRRHLLEDIAESLGAILQLNRLGIERERQLRAALAQAEEIAVSRRQAVAEMDSERRSIERNLHDGAQHHLVSLRLALGLVGHELGSGQLEQARDRLGRLVTQIDTAEAVLTETAAGVSAALLAERGLLAALSADLAGGHPPIVLSSEGIPADRRFPPAVEAVVYFCCLEAVNNARKHAPGAAVQVQLRERDGRLGFTVRDQGPGFVPRPDGVNGAGPGGRGLRNITARIAAVGGTISINSVPGDGTTIEGSVGVPVEDRAGAEVVTGGHALLDQVRRLVGEARECYDGSAAGEQLRELLDQLDEPLPAGGLPPAGALKARWALGKLEALVRSSPRSGQATIRLRYQLEKIRSGTHELAELDLLEELRSGVVPLEGEDRQAAEQLLGAAGAGWRTRLGLAAEAGTDEVRQAAGLALARWRRRAAHPTSTRAVRDAAEVLVLTCEELLDRIGAERAG